VELITLKLPYYNIIVIEVPNAILQEQLPQIEWEEESIYFKEAKSRGMYKVFFGLI